MLLQRVLTPLLNKSAKDNTKVLLCCIGKNENKYVREFVEWYKNIGFAHIVIYDNNDCDGERFEDVIQDYIEDGFVELVDYRGKKVCQVQAYTECYRARRSDYGWIAFFDMDEFLELKQDVTVGEYLSRDMFNGFWMVHVNWMCFGDNGNLSYSEAPLMERFPEPAPADIMNSWWDRPTNDHIKSIVRCHELLPLWWRVGPHTPSPVGIKCCNASGKPCNARSVFSKYDFSYAYLRHYTTKSAEEYLKKLERGYPDQILREEQIGALIDLYFDINPDTKDRRQYIDRWLSQKTKTVCNY